MSDLGDSVRGIRRAVSDARNSDTTGADRALVVVVLVAGAAILLWPRDRPLPRGADNVVSAARHIWSRRGWFEPGGQVINLHPVGNIWTR